MIVGRWYFLPFFDLRLRLEASSRVQNAQQRHQLAQVCPQHSLQRAPLAPARVTATYRTDIQRQLYQSYMWPYFVSHRQRLLGPQLADYVTEQVSQIIHPAKRICCFGTTSVVILDAVPTVFGSLSIRVDPPTWLGERPVYCRCVHILSLYR